MSLHLLHQHNLHVLQSPVASQVPVSVSGPSSGREAVCPRLISWFKRSALVTTVDSEPHGCRSIVSLSQNSAFVKLQIARVLGREDDDGNKIVN